MKRMSLVPVAINPAQLIVCSRFFQSPLLITGNSVLGTGRDRKGELRCLHMFACVFAFACVCMDVHSHVCVCACVCPCTYVCVCARMQLRSCILWLS